MNDLSESFIVYFFDSFDSNYNYSNGDICKKLFLKVNDSGIYEFSLFRLEPLWGYFRSQTLIKEEGWVWS